MNDDGFFEKLVADLAARAQQPIEAALLVHRTPETGGQGLAKVFRRSAPETQLGHNNLLWLTPTHLHLTKLGGRSGVKPREDVVVWDRRTVSVTVEHAHRSSWMASTGSHYEYDTHRLHLVGPELSIELDAMQENHFVDPVAHLQVLLAACGAPPAA